MEEEGQRRPHIGTQSWRFHKPLYGKRESHGEERREGLFLDQRRAAEAGWEGIYRANLESRVAHIPRTFLGLEFLKIEQCGIWHDTTYTNST